MVTDSTNNDDMRDFDDFLLGEEEEDTTPSPIGDEDVVSLDDAVSSLQQMVVEAVDFMESELVPEWESAEKYYNGETDLRKVEGRSRATQTPVRDAVRALKTSIMRVFCQNERIVEYKPRNPQFGPIAELQSSYVHQLFWDSRGYMALLDVVQDALLKKVGIMQVYHQDNYTPMYMQATGITQETLSGLMNNPNIAITNVTQADAVGELPFFDVEFTYVQIDGKICLEHVPLFEFFISDEASSIQNARVVGRRRSIAVGDAIAMGLEYDDWTELDDLDPEEDEAVGESEKRRGYVKDRGTDTYEVDPAMKKFLLTQVYARFDLEGTGVPQLYCFWLGGTSYEYISHDKVDRCTFKAFHVDPQPATFFGKSLYDILKENQDVETSLIRAIIDNAHAANNRRLAVHEHMVNLGDVLSPKIGAPIRFKAPGMIQEIGVEPMAASLLPISQFLKQQGEVKSGVTSASLGLEPEALQSTDKDAVRNTIELAQGQVEFMTRNLAETGFVDVFRDLLHLSIMHFQREITFNGIQIDQALFQPDLPFEPKVGLGSIHREMKLQALTDIIMYQKEVLTQVGFGNPIVTLQQHYAALEDRSKLMGVYDLSRYVTPIDPQQEQQLQAMIEQKRQPPPQPDPSQALIPVEQIKSQTALQKAQIDAQIKQAEIEAEAARQDQQTRAKMAELLMRDDLDRDEMLQKLYIEAAKLNNEILDREEVRKVQAQTQARAAERRDSRGSAE